MALLLALNNARPAPDTGVITPMTLAVRDAEAGDIAALPGAGPSLGSRLMLLKRFAVLRTPDSLRWVPGIGARRLDRWWPWLCGDGEPASEDVAWGR